jgi:hypothetical protein
MIQHPTSAFRSWTGRHPTSVVWAEATFNDDNAHKAQPADNNLCMVNLMAATSDSFSWIGVNAKPTVSNGACYENQAAKPGMRAISITARNGMEIASPGLRQAFAGVA